MQMVNKRLCKHGFIPAFARVRIVELDDVCYVSRDNRGDFMVANRYNADLQIRNMFFKRYSPNEFVSLGEKLQELGL